MSNEHRKEELNRKALELYTQDRFLDAAECLDTLLSEFPEEHGARTFKAWCLMDARDYGAAYQTFMENKDLDSNNPRLWHGLSLTLKAMGFGVGALPAIEKAIALTPDVAEFHNERATVLFLMGRMDESLESLDEAIALQPYQQDAWTLKGRVLQIMGMADEALESFIHAKVLNPEDPLIRMSISSILSDKGRDDEALSMIDEAIDIAVNPRGFIFHKAGLLKDMNRHEEALSTYHEGFDLEIEIDTPLKQAMEAAAYQNIGSIFSGMGICLNHLGLHEVSLIYYDKVLEMNPYDTNTWFWKGYALQMLDRYEESILAYDKVNELDPDPDAYSIKGNMLMEMGRCEEAILAFDLSLDMEDDRYDDMERMGECLEALGRHKEAEASYRKTLEINRDSAYTWVRLARTQSAQGMEEDAASSYQEALAACDRLEEEYDVNPHTWKARSQAYMGLGMTDEADRWDEKAEALFATYEEDVE